MSQPSGAPTARDVARLAGVSSATVSYVLSGRRNGKDRISPETRERVLDAVAELGYVPNLPARSLRRQRTERVCLVLPRLNSPHYDVLAEDSQRAAEAHGYSLIVAASGSPERERQILNQLRRRLADGVIIEPRHVDGADIAPLVKAGLSVVVHSDYVTGTGFDIVRTERAQTSYQAVNYLLDQGHRRIAFIGNFASHPIYYGRFESYRQALQERGIAVDERLIKAGSGSREEAYHSARALLQLDQPPTAIFSSSDIGAISAIWAAHGAGLRVPADLAVIGVGNTPEGKITHPALTTIGPVATDFSDIAGLLFSRLAGKAPPEGRIHLRQWQLIRRESA